MTKTWFVSSFPSLKRFDLESVLCKTYSKVNKSIPSRSITSSSKPKKLLLAKKVPLIWKLSFSTIFSFFNFHRSVYICLGVKDTIVIGLPFISKVHLFVTLPCITLLSYLHDLPSNKWLVYISITSHNISSQYLPIKIAFKTCLFTFTSQSSFNRYNL